MRALVIGASGFNGSRLAERLRAKGHWVRGLVRDPARAPRGLDEVVVADVTTGRGLRAALRDADTAYYFVHSLDSRRQHQDDLRAATNVVSAARAEDLRHGVFFTTLAVPDGVTPPLYQRNRLAVENVLLGGLPTMAAVRAGMVLGPQSRGFRPYLQLVERAPVIPLGPWRRHKMAVVDPETVTECLAMAGEDRLSGVIDVPASGHPDHEEILRAVADAFGRHPRIIGLPWSAATIDARMSSWFTDDSYGFSRHLASINMHDYLVDPSRSEPFAAIRPATVTAGIAAAVQAYRGSGAS